MATRTLYLLDISSYIYRAFHAIRGLSNSKGFPTNAIFGVTSMLLKVIRERQPQYLALTFDTKAPTFRHRRFPDYKAHRPPMPADLAAQLPILRQVIDAFNLPSLEVEGFEADDLICTLTRRAREAGFEVEIISGDKDLLPLVGEGVTMWDPMKEVRFDEAAIREKFGVAPAELVEVRALAGDASDNVPGVPGIGEKTALKLISQYHGLENLLAEVKNLKEKGVRDRLVQHADLARMSRELVVLKEDAPIDAALEDLRPGPPDRQTLRRLFVELEFSKFNKELGVESVPAATVAMVKPGAELERLAAQVRQAGEAAVFFVNGELHPVLAPVYGLGLAWGEEAAVFVPWAELSQDQIWPHLGPWLAAPEVKKLGADLKAAMLITGRSGQKLEGAAGDILLASYLLNPARYEQNLENVVLHYLGLNLLSPRELAGRPAGAGDLPAELQAQYAGSRADAIRRVWPLLKAELEQEGLWDLYRDLELPLVGTLARMEARGIAVDQPYLERLGKELAGEMGRLEEEIFRLAGEPFLINSPQQLGRILFEKLGLAPQKKTKGKTAYSTDSEVLQSLAAQAPIAADVLNYRSLGKLKATYVEALLKLVNPETGRVHTTFVQSAAATGRLSSRDPNLQNIPVRGEMGGQLRQAFVAGPGRAFLSADYSQMELRLLAHFSQDPVLLKAFAEGVDIHRETAATVFNIHPELVSAEMRRQAKVINFGIIYGMSAFGLAKQLGVGNRLAQEFIARYFDRHRRVKAYLDDTLAQARERGWVTTLMGRRRQTTQLNSTNRLVRQEAERSAINTPLQGTAADIIKKSMLEAEAALAQAGLSAALLLQIHDELLFEVPVAEVAPTARIVRQVMESVVHLEAPLMVEIRTGANWGELNRLEKLPQY